MLTNTLSDDYDNEQTAAEAWDVPGVDIFHGSSQRRLLRTLLQSLATLDDSIDDVYADRFVMSASGTALDLLSGEVNLQRQTGESDDRLRRRILARYKQRQSSGTYDDLAAVSKILVDTNDVQIEAAEETGGGTARVIYNEADLNASPFTSTEVTEILEESLIATDTLDVGTTGRFVFSSDGNDTGKGFGQGTWAPP